MAAAAYRSGEKLHSEHYSEDSDYAKKGGVICSEILLPSHAPPLPSLTAKPYGTRWRSRTGKAQLAYRFDIAFAERVFHAGEQGADVFLETERKDYHMSGPEERQRAVDLLLRHADDHAPRW